MPKKTSVSPDDPDLEILERLPESVKDDPEVIKTIRLIASRHTRWEGPLPPPDIFKQYPPDVRNAIVKQASSQLKHRQSLEKRVITSNIRNSGRGMDYAFWITVALIVAGVILIMMGKSTEGLIAIFGPTIFHGVNFFVQKWKEFRAVSRDAAKDNNKEVSKPNHDE